jgi:hypothetical protein
MLRHTLLSAILAWAFLAAFGPAHAVAGPSADTVLTVLQPDRQTEANSTTTVALRSRNNRHNASSRANRNAMNRKRFPADRALVIKNGGFPRLGNNFEVLAPHSDTYNCIAWSMGIKDHWVWPGYSMSAFDKAYSRLGYRRLKSVNLRHERGVQKIVLYGTRTGNGSVNCTHAARQSSDGTWTSKLGKLPLIRHQSANALSGSSYGHPVAVYAKKKR